MIGKEAYIFLAVLAMAAGLSVPVPRNCEDQSDTNCKDCLGYDDIDIGDGSKKSNCAWFIRHGEEPQCIARNRCDDKGFEGGECVVGFKNKPSRNNNRCKKAIKNTCEGISSCKDCLLGGNNFLNCAYFIQGDETRCIAESRCDDEGFEGGDCYSKKPKSTSAPVGIEKCSDFSGDNSESCLTCLGQGCSWIQQSKECLDSCEEAPADVGCVKDDEHEYPITAIELEPITTIDPDNTRRSLLSFPDNKSFVCYTVSLNERNNIMCSNASETGGCAACRTTPLLDTFLYPLHPPTCKYSSDQGCYAIANPQLEPPEPLFCDFPNNCTTWPELLGWNNEQARIYLLNIYGEEIYGEEQNIEIQMIGPGDLYTEDIQLNRIRLFYNDDDIIDKIPRTEHSDCNGTALPKEGTKWPEFMEKDAKDMKGILSNAYSDLVIILVNENDPVTNDYLIDRVFLFHNLEGKISKVPMVG